MKFLIGLACVIVLQAGSVEAAECVASPSDVLRICVDAEGGRAFYEVSRRGQAVLKRSALGLAFVGEAQANVTLGEARHSAHDQTWEQPWGEQRVIRDVHNEMRVAMRGDTQNSKAFDIVVRAFDEGFGLRYDYHGISSGQEVAIGDELTQFRPASKYQAWWFDAYQKERDEYLYRRTP
ncbi:MAG TPA: glycoside hydrolase family 97 N-terminal domain-containing protein, partial [Steroidobacter sp.]